MFRRSRLSIRPNVGTAGRTAGSPLEASSSIDQDNGDTRVKTPVSLTDNQSADLPTEPTTGTDQNGEAASSSAIQRRKRFSVRPKVIPGRPSALPRTPKSPVKPVLPAVKSPVPVNDKAETSTEANCTAPHQERPSPKQCQPSDESNLCEVDTISPCEGSSKCIDHPGKIQSLPCSQVKEISPKAPVPRSIPDREAIDISEKAKTLMSKTELATSSQHFSLTQLLNDKSDLLRLEKARKLRQLLKQEMLKEKSKKYMARGKEFTLDPSKMTMRDLIHYLPTSNPMTSTLEESAMEIETAIPQSPGREISPERAQEQEVQTKVHSPHREATATTSAEGEPEHEEEEAEEAGDEDEDALMVPQVKVAEDGTLIIDEESLTVEVQRMKGPNPIQDRDPIFERGSTTTYSSFRKGTHTKPWSTEETDMFFLAISMVGTDFAMISQLFPHRARSEIKNKFKKEERFNAWRIDKAFRERRRLDLEYFKKLLEKILEFQQNKKKLKSISERPKTSKRKAKGKKVLPALSDVEEENEDRVSTEEQEGEKENLCSDKTLRSITKRKRKPKDDLSSESPAGKKKEKRERKKKSDDTGALSDLEEAAISEDHLSLDQSKKTEAQSAKTAETKSARPLPLSRKSQRAKKSKAFISDTEETTSEKPEGQITKDPLSSQQSAKSMSDIDSSDHETTVQSARPSRYGRISKPVQPLNYPAKEDTNSSASDTLASPAQSAAARAKNKTHGKRGRSARQKTTKESKKPKLITLRASQSEGSDDDEEETEALHYDENSTSAFVPASLCSPKPVVPEVEETMEELDMLAHMPDVLGMSKNALCPDASCEQVHNEIGTVEPCEHQLDLLVDVIDFLSEHTEASEDESYNEAAQTLLAIGNLASLAQPTESEPTLSDHISKFESGHCIEVDVCSKSSSEQAEFTALVSEPSKTENVTTNSPREQSQTSFLPDTQLFTSIGKLSKTEETGLSTGVLSPRAKNSLSSRKGRLYKIKPKPNIGSATKTAKQFAPTIGAAMEAQPVELEIAATSQYQSLEQLEESTLDVSEQSKTDSGSASDLTVELPTSHVSNAQVSYEPCCKKDTVDSPQVQKTPTPKLNSSPPMRLRLPKIKPNIGCALRTKKQASDTEERKTQVESEIASTCQLGSFEHQEESSQAVYEPDESSCTQGTATTSQLETSCADNSSAPRRLRLPRIKPRLNIECTRTTKLSSQSLNAIEEKLCDEAEMASASQLGSTKPQVEPIIAEHLKCQNEITEGKTKEMLASLTCDTQVIKHHNDSSTIQETAATSQLETPCSKISVPCNATVSKIKPKPNIESTEQSSQSVDTTDKKHQTMDEAATPSQLQSVALSPSESLVESSQDFYQKSMTSNSTGTEADQSNRFNLAHDNISRPQGQGEEPCTLEHLGQFTAMSSTSSDQCAVEPLEQPGPVENSTSQEVIPSTQSDNSSTEDKTEHIRPVHLSDLSSESLKHSTPQRKRWIPKVKPKPNLVSSPRTAKPRLESKEKSQVTGELVRSSLLNAKSEQPMLQDGSTAKSHNYLQSFYVEPNSVISVPSLGALDKTPLTASGVNTNIAKFRSSFVPGCSNRSIKDVSKSDTICEDPSTVLEHCELGAANQTNLDHCNRMEWAPSESSKTVHQPHDFTLKNTVPPDQVPSDPDEPFFILSLTEIPVCPSGEEVDPRPESYHILPDTESQQSNPVEPVVPLTAGIDDSLSNIHLPTPEKATLKSGLICVEQYLPSTPSVDISLLEEPQENPSIRRLNLPETESNIEHHDILSADQQPPVRGDDKQNSRRQNLMSKTVKKANKPEITTQDPPESFPQIESSQEVESQAKESDVSSAQGKMKMTAETRGNKSQTKKPKPSCEPLWEQTENQSSEAPITDSLTWSFSSTVSQTPTSSSELLDLNQIDPTNVLDEGPTNVSEYFFGDVFTEVESDSVSGNIIGNPACRDKTQSQPAEAEASLRQHSNSPCGQESPMTSPQKTDATADEATSSNLPDSSATETTAHSSQQENKRLRGRGKRNAKREDKKEENSNSRPQRKSTTDATCLTSLQNTLTSTNVVMTDSSQRDTKKTRGKGNSKIKSRALCVNLKPLRNSTEALETPEAVLQDSLTQSTSSAVQPQNQQGSLLGSTEVPVRKKDWDVEGECGSSSFTETINKDTACRDKMQTQMSETSGKLRKKRITKASRGPPLNQELAHEITPEAHKTTFDPSLMDLEKSRGKRRSKRTSDGATAQRSRPQRQDTTTSTSPARISEALSASPSTLQASNQSDSKESTLFDDEPTNVSQYFLSDIFTDVDEEFKS